MNAYYNENEPFAAEWLRNLIREGLIAPGDVDERDIRDVRPDELAGYDQCHFFAGIGGWSRALRLAGWPDDRPVWTGSCPCQPFSTAGGQAGFADERHLWPAWFWLIAQCRPPVVFGEQVANGAARQWIDLVQSDLEGIGYAFGPVDLPAGGVGAPHQRQRAWFVAESDSWQRRWIADGERREPNRNAAGRVESHGGASGDSATGELDNATGPRHAGERQGTETETRDQARLRGPERGCGVGELAEGIKPGLEGHARYGDGGHEPGRVEAHPAGPASEGGGALPEPFASALHGFWRDADWLLCTDGKWRPVEPGLEPLADGLPGRVGRLRAYGNAIVPQVAAEVIKAYGG